ncbi:DUF3138 family protein [Caldimonas caldifontis]|uniref:DUF3138 domain-containing protein n=1 Tax=Caldimonas caldifontis TaxID=1452508 RepID=A0A2S5STX2_9BURK|nr:DUF3138 family protein [Caldimonas caldifontis]PPE66017.1 hypothetical protein C1704_12075 [Caldimonas caldifontis]
MTTTWKITTLSLALMAAFPLAGHAQSNKELLDELRALQQRVQELERKLKAAEAAPAPAPSAGMTPDQQVEFNRIRAKTEALEDNQEASGFKGLRISGMMDPTFLWTDRYGESFAFLNNFDGVGNSYGRDAYAFDNSYFGQAVIDIVKETEDQSIWRLTLLPHKSGSSGFNVGSWIHEASVSVPITDNQTRFWAGVIPDWSGYEYPFSHQHPLISHNLLFDFTLPSYYTGAAIDITRGKWWNRIGIANVNANRYDRDARHGALVYRIDYSKGEFDGFGFAGVHGKEAGETINLFQFDAYYIRGNWTWQGQVALGSADAAASNDGRAQWWGLSGLMAYNFTPTLQGIFRADYIHNEKNGGGIYGSPLSGGEFDGRNGFGPKLASDGSVIDPDKGANRYAMTFGLKYLYSLNTTFKLEYRFDGSNGYNFYDEIQDRYRKRAHMLSTAVVLNF